MKIYILPDKLNWAYYAIALALKKHNPYTDVQIDIKPIKGNIKDIKKKYKINQLYKYKFYVIILNNGMKMKNEKHRKNTNNRMIQLKNILYLVVW